jgi:hypothetical protein
MATSMARSLTCDCGYQLQLSDADEKELLWCPLCKKVLSKPAQYTSALDNIVKGGRAPAPRTSSSSGSSSGSRSGRWGIGIIVAIVIGVIRVAALTSRSTPEPVHMPQPVNYAPPRTERIQWQPPPDEWQQRQDNQRWQPRQDDPNGQPPQGNQNGKNGNERQQFNPNADPPRRPR